MRACARPSGILCCQKVAQSWIQENRPIAMTAPCSTGRSLLIASLCFSDLAGAVLRSAAAEPYGLESRAPIAGFLNNNLPPALPQGEWAAVKAFPQLTLPDPLGFGVSADATRAYVHCRGGQIYFFDNNPDATNKTLFLDIHARTQGWDDCGLLGLAFHPQFGQP